MASLCSSRANHLYLPIRRKTQSNTTNLINILQSLLSSCSTTIYSSFRFSLSLFISIPFFSFSSTQRSPLFFFSCIFISFSSLLYFYFIFLLQSRFRYGVCFWGRSTNVEDVFLPQKRGSRSIAGINNGELRGGHFSEYKISTSYIFEMFVYVPKLKFN